MLPPVDVVEVIDAIFQPALADFAVPTSLLRRSRRRRNDLCLPQLGSQVYPFLSSLARGGTARELGSEAS